MELSIDGDLRQCFVELEQLSVTQSGRFEWKEKSRWVKLEEDIEEGSNRWSKPFVPSLSFKALTDLKLLLRQGRALLDINSANIKELAAFMCKASLEKDIITEERLSDLLGILLAEHHHHFQKEHLPKPTSIEPLKKEGEKCVTGGANTLTVDLLDVKPSVTIHKTTSSIARCLNDYTEATSILVARLDYIIKPAVIFVRLRRSTVFSNLNEVAKPVRFLYLVVATNQQNIDVLQIGKAIGTMMSDSQFFNTALTCDGISDLISGVDYFLLSSIVLPGGPWDLNMLTQSLLHWNECITEQPAKNRKTTALLNDRSRERLMQMFIKEEEHDPLVRTGKIFGGLKKDFERKLPNFISDFTDGFNRRCLIVVIFSYFSFFAPAITFAALLSKETEGLLGVIEMICATSLCGVLFALFGGQPLMVLGATGPLLVMETSIYQLSLSIGVAFLPWRAWIGFWITFFCILIVAFDMSFLVSYFTVFTEEIVATLISTVFIYESFRHVSDAFKSHHAPLLRNTPNVTSNRTNRRECSSHTERNDDDGKAFMTIILLFGTFLLCHYLRKIRHSQYFPLSLRRLLSDFGLLMAVSVFLCFDIFMEDNFTSKLEIPEFLTPTVPSQRDWLIDITGGSRLLTTYEIILAIVPAFLVTILLFMETQVTGTIIDRKEHKLKKGAGHNLNMLVVGILVSVCSIFGLPWMCACPVHSISHLNSLSVLSKNHAPGTRAYVTEVMEQRITNIAMHLLIGSSIFLGPVLRNIPIAILFGIFLHLGVTTLSHLQLTKRIKLLFIPAKYHPDWNFVRKVQTRKIHLFTGIQIFCFIIVFAVKSSTAAPSFPFLVLLLIPLRKYGLPKVFTEDELDQLDNEGKIEGETDEYDVIHVPM